MRCPKCNVDMSEMTMLMTTIDVCPLCNGCWLDKDELARITRSRGANALTGLTLVDKHKTQFKCPRCQGELQEGSHDKKSDFLIDQCDKCGGIWLDRGELTTMLTLK